MTVKIEGIEYVAIEDVNKEIAEQIGEDISDIGDQLDVASLQERKERIADELTTKQAEHDARQQDKAVTQLIKKTYASKLKDPDSFIGLVKAKGLTDETDIHNLFAKIPKKAKKNVIERWLK